MSVSKRFLDLTSRTWPHKTERVFAETHLPASATVDQFGNWIVDVPGGSGRIMFSSHLDDVSVWGEKVQHRMFHDGRLATDGKTILGADCKAGVALMLEMIHHGIPGHYVFHADEEAGGQPGRQRAAAYQEMYSKFTHAIAFDRRDYGSIITKMRGYRTASDEFAKALGAQLEFGFPDDTGSFTDTHSYAGIIPECTNISVGYHEAHTKNEWQSLPYLEWLCARLLRVQWDQLPHARLPQPPYVPPAKTNPLVYPVQSQDELVVKPTCKFLPRGIRKPFQHPEYGQVFHIKYGLVRAAFEREASAEVKRYDWHECEVEEFLAPDDRFVMVDPDKDGHCLFAAGFEVLYTHKEQRIIVCGIDGTPLVCRTSNWLRMGTLQ